MCVCVCVKVGGVWVVWIDITVNGWWAILLLELREQTLSVLNCVLV